MKPIAIYGAGGFAREVVALLRDINAAEPTWDIAGFLDDSPDRRGDVLVDVPVLGGVEWLDAHPDIHLVLGVGSPVAKRRIHARTRGRVAGFPTLIHPSVVRTPYVDFGEGAVITAGTILTVDIRVGRFAMLNLHCTVGHDAVIGAFSTLSPGVNLSGHVTVGSGCDIGTGAKVIPGVEIGEWSIVGAGAVVAGSLPGNCTAVGVPARVIRERERGWQEK
jgi:sugar O-acyltransferase (sialic acid O-acetyltransferase NeuD family)